ncbi:recombination regulator RecX [Rhodococcus sp. 14-2483-1-1]|uniref:regulatory protein RecX n=1 Tax=Nocardiaceae TaxID=85025 RepID=UPI00050C51F7|nr:MULTISPECIES: regulatory protein RecX [Rhodococcus]OZC43145.1 recombination regulator RecX [Rhodococcus sp. WWJCD1]OZE74536.1 recombination regulator RecX [Rhodococcus sp. 15-649-2-2]OZF30056.1 recombination regulator RecX [Rhodococcus sp. 14-2483-1-1]QII01057.1 regulatory protein RecX [Rhodococcus fascians A21d2]
MQQRDEGGGTEAQAKDVCLRLLTDRARSRHELEANLAKKGFTAEITAAVLDRLEKAKLVDDESFAQQWVQSRHKYSGKGKRALSMELRTKGVSNELAVSALDLIDADDERQRAGELVRKRFRTLRLPDSSGPDARVERDKVVRKLVGMLARRGYSQGMAFAVVKEELDRAGADTEDFDGPDSM